MIVQTPTSKKGFTILIALGTIGILLIIATSLASIYINELKLSRLQYNNILAYAQAEGAFEYAMLKGANHVDGFEDSFTDDDPDRVLFAGSTPRTEGSIVTYEIDSHARESTLTIPPNSDMIIPLFIGTGSLIPGAVSSLDPRESGAKQKVGELALDITANIDGSTAGVGSLSWSIIALSGSNISISGTGEVDPFTSGTIRLRGVDCYDKDGNKGDDTSIDLYGNCNGLFSPAAGGEMIEYTYDSGALISDFLSEPSHQNPYLLLYNSGTIDLTLQIRTDTSHTLPVLQVLTRAKKGNSMQSIRYSENKSRYYDALRYGIYNNP